MNWSKAYGVLSSGATFISNLFKIGGGIGAVMVWAFGQDWVASLTPRLAWVNARCNLSWTLVAFGCLGCAWTGVAVGRRLVSAQETRVPSPRRMHVLDLILFELFAQVAEGGSMDASQAHEVLEHVRKSPPSPEWARSPVSRGYSMVQVKAAFVRMSERRLIDYGYLNHHLSPAGLKYYDKHATAIAEILGINHPE